MKVIIETSNLVLREFDEMDLENLLQLDTDPQVMKYISDGKAATIEETQGVLDQLVAQNRNSDRYGLWACELRTTHEFLGWFHMRLYKENPVEIELGY
jgi:RimJ/RimL family protein N-acetyltransferase